MSIMRQVQL